jgi:hypothetical protein
MRENPFPREIGPDDAPAIPNPADFLLDIKRWDNLAQSGALTEEHMRHGSRNWTDIDGNLQIGHRARIFAVILILQDNGSHYNHIWGQPVVPHDIQEAVTLAASLSIHEARVLANDRHTLHEIKEGLEALIVHFMGWCNARGQDINLIDIQSTKEMLARTLLEISHIAALARPGSNYVEHAQRVVAERMGVSPDPLALAQPAPTEQ